MHIDQLRERFITAAGGRKPTEEQAITVETNRQRIFAAAQQVNTLPENRYQSMALTALEEALMWANKAVFYQPLSAVEDPGLGGVLEQHTLVAGPQWPGQATPGQPIVSDSSSGRTLYTPVGPVRVDDLLEYWDTPSGPTSAETWRVESIKADGTTHARSTVSRGVTVLGARVWQVGGPWRVLSDTAQRWFARNARPGWLIERVKDGKRFRIVGLHDGDVLTETTTEPPQTGPTFKVTDFPITIIKIEEEA